MSEKHAHHLRGYSTNPAYLPKESTSPARIGDGSAGVGKGTSSDGGSASVSGGVNSKHASQQPARKDAHEEFFMLCLLSYKLNHQGTEKILQVKNI